MSLKTHCNQTKINDLTTPTECKKIFLIKNETRNTFEKIFFFYLAPNNFLMEKILIFYTGIVADSIINVFIFYFSHVSSFLNTETSWYFTISHGFIRFRRFLSAVLYITRIVETVTRGGGRGVLAPGCKNKKRILYFNDVEIMILNYFHGVAEINTSLKKTPHKNSIT